MAASSGCLGCHRIGHNGNAGPGPGPDRHRRPPAERRRSRRTLLNPTAPMPSYRGLSEKNPQQFDELVEYLASLR